MRKFLFIPFLVWVSIAYADSYTPPGGGGPVTAVSGAYASGAYASGSLSNGAIADIGNITSLSQYSGSGQPATIGGLIWDLDVLTRGAIPAGTNTIGYTSADPCAQGKGSPFSFSSASGEFQIVAPSGTTQVYICSLILNENTPSVAVSVVGGTGATCTTGTPVALAGSTTAANGMTWPVTGGFTFGNGGATALKTTTAGHGVCILQSGTTQISGGGMYVQQ